MSFSAATDTTPLALPGLGPPPPEPVARARDAEGALHELFGHPGFRRGQEEAVAAALAGRDVLVVMPTGSGKSLCYQLPALMRADLTLVVSPLVSLMQDQVEALERVAPGRVALVNAQQDAATNRRALEAAVSGHVRLLYVAPERFASPGFVEKLRTARIGLFVVDEAHCVSQWGHDFRPDYFRLADAARYLGAEAIVASTATATPQVASDIVERLGLRDPVRVSTGFDRPNLSFAVVPCATKEAGHRGIAAALAEPGALPGIVYAGTRAECDKLSGRLERELGEPVLAYHAGLPRDVRAEAQRRFMAGEVRVVVATNAFGMGVDKADVRTVCHETVPGSLEAYYQEAGRAGRDGAPARCLLFASSRDKGLHVFFIERSTVEDHAIGRVAQRVLARAADGRYDLTAGELSATAGCDEEGVRSILGHLARAKVIQPAPSAPDRALGRVTGPWDGKAMAACRSSAQDGTRARWKQYRSVWAFVEGSRCRREAMLRHFGDTARPAPEGPCCDVCDPELRPELPSARPRRSAPARPAQLAQRPAAGSELDDAILDVVASAQPEVGRTRAVEILRGGRSKVIVQHSYDGLPHYGTFGHLAAPSVLERVDALLQAGTLRSTGGRFPKLEVA
ncbi:MAG: ATP-dependent DNA helicase RecQ [uncultured Solirubrobacteraceae bacterium]|uniref:ATP-dependent DNA helicase RecQ n=1 Tax=uncultured Solirubrobacteraceae bacterium TaxID=1162706 RepID=A0A6J4T505_9ACTN|nr:MAG: ATP-dependent DNA helicase RecQ [uncultured Solirubrobacteraceae bacterium]